MELVQCEHIDLETYCNISVAGDGTADLLVLAVAGNVTVTDSSELVAD